MNPTGTARILLADRHPALLAEAARVLQRDYEVVGTAAKGLALLDCAERFDGFEAVRRPRARGLAPGADTYVIEPRMALDLIQTQNHKL
jgi:hypothetical protein